MTKEINQPLNPNLHSNLDRNCQDTKSKAFIISTLGIMLWPRVFVCIDFNNSWVRRIFSDISLPSTKADCSDDIRVGINDFIHIQRIFVNTFFRKVQRLIGLNSANVCGCSFFGSSMIKVLAILFGVGTPQKNPRLLATGLELLCPNKSCKRTP